jgi:hypothetical protein
MMQTLLLLLLLPLLLLLLLPGVPHKPLATRWTRSSVATAAEDDADGAAIRETLAAYRFAGNSLGPLVRF